MWASGEWVLCWAVGSGLFWEQLHGWLAVSPALCVKEEGHRVKRAESKERKQTGRSVAPGGPWQPSGRWAPWIRPGVKPDTRLFLSNITQKWRTSGKGTGGGKEFRSCQEQQGITPTTELWNLQLRSHHAWDTCLSSLQSKLWKDMDLWSSADSPKQPGTVRGAQ